MYINMSTYVIHIYGIAVDQSDDILGDRTPSTLARIRVRGDHGSDAVATRTRERFPK